MATELEVRKHPRPPRYNGVPVVIFAALVVLFGVFALVGALL